MANTTSPELVDLPMNQILNSKETSNSAPSLNQENISTWRLWMLSISLCLGLFLSLLDTTIVATVLQSIGREFDSDVSVAWVATAYTLSYLGCCVIYANIGNIIERHRAYISAFIIFVSFSLGCGFAQTLNQLIALRALQGIGGAGLYTLTIVIFSQISPPRMLQHIAGIIGAVLAVSGILGPVLGGGITQHTTWRWVFWINCPVGTLGMALFILSWPKPEQIRPSPRQKLRQLDIVGSILLAGASVLIVYSLLNEATLNSWRSSLFLGPFISGCICWLLLFGWQLLVRRRWENSIEAVFPFRFLKNRIYIATVATTLLSGFPYFAVLYSLPLRFQVVNELNTLAAGLGLLPLLGGAAVGSLAGGQINARYDNTFYTQGAGACFMLLGTSLLSTLLSVTHPEPKTYGFQVFIGIGFGILVSSASISATMESSIKDLAVAQAIIAQVRILGGSIGIAVTTLIRSHLLQQQPSNQVAEPGDASSPFDALADSDQQTMAEVYSNWFNSTMRVSAVVAAVSVVTVLFTFRQKRLLIADQRRLRFVEHQQMMNDFVRSN